MQVGYIGSHLARKIVSAHHTAVGTWVHKKELESKSILSCLSSVLYSFAMRTTLLVAALLPSCLAALFSKKEYESGAVMADMMARKEVSTTRTTLLVLEWY